MRWQDDPGFCSWLIAAEYARDEGGTVKPYLSGGVVLYMYEAYQQGKARG